MKRKLPISRYYSAINLLKKFRNEPFQQFSYNRRTFYYGKKMADEILTFNINTVTNVLSVRLFDSFFNQKKYEVIRLSEKETVVFYSILKAVLDEAKR